jgi:maltose phosphorylase
MKRIFEADPWKVIGNVFDNDTNEIAESIMSLANGHMGFRGNFEEDFSGSTLKGTYIAGVYYPDKTKVGWWKNGYPEYFAKVLNACDMISIHLWIDGEKVDLSKCHFENFTRELDMRHGTFIRKFDVVTMNGKKVRISSLRFVSMEQKEIGAIRYTVQPIGDSLDIRLISYLNGDVRNKDSNFDDMFWEKISVASHDGISNITMVTKKTGFIVSSSACEHVAVNGVDLKGTVVSDDGLYIGNEYSSRVEPGSLFKMFKYFSVTTSRDYETSEVTGKSLERTSEARKTGFDALLEEHSKSWASIWSYADVVIKGDMLSQQGIRFNIFHLFQTYTGHDNRLNIGPKGFTGEKYGGSTYWDTEAFCFPFFLSTAREDVARSLLIYRYNHLENARKNAKKLGLEGALYPMVTMNGEECHNEWEITFEEIHRNGAIAYAIYNYVNYTGGEEYLQEYGLHVLYEIARFWASRVNYNPRKKKYMILGVTGPNEYENNVSNNWYTNTMAAFCLRYASDVADGIRKRNFRRFAEIAEEINISDDEISKFLTIAENMYFPYIDELDVFAQQDGFIDKELLTVDDLLPSDRPINQNWSWDRILRSCFIKQADVIQAFYFFPFEYDSDVKKRNFDFYEPMTVHESSLSSCIYSVLASDIGYFDKAYELYLRASRLDIDNYNNDTGDGLHITSTAGSWLAIVHGFGGLRVRDGMLRFNPALPEKWTGYSFIIYFRGRSIKINVMEDMVSATLLEGEGITISIWNNEIDLSNDKRVIEIKGKSESEEYYE